MAKQIGPFFVCGSYGNACFYQCNGQYYMRSKSSLSGKRVKRDTKFAITMQYAKWMGEASKIASGVYRKLYAGNKSRKIYQLLTGKALKLLKEGKNKNEIVELLYKEAEDLIFKAQRTDCKITVSKKIVHLPERITI